MAKDGLALWNLITKWKNNNKQSFKKSLIINILIYNFQLHLKKNILFQESYKCTSREIHAAQGCAFSVETKKEFNKN